jgi:alpha-ketoglutarate-dependent taurine dioxygenase
MNIPLPREPLLEKVIFDGTIDELLASIDKTKLKLIPTTTGIVSTVEIKDDTYDWNKTSEDFYFHQDGSHLSIKPEYVALLCKHPGDGKAVTTFTDARKVYTSLAKEFEDEFLRSLVAVYVDKDRNVYKRSFVEKNYNGNLYVNTFHYIEPDVTKIKEKDRRIFNLTLPKLLLTYERLQNEHIFYKHTFNKNDLVIFRNQECHHSKTGMSTDDKDRFLYRIWFSENL